MNTLELYELSGMIDQSALHPTMGIKDLEEHCLTAKKWHTASVCVKPCDVARAVALMAGSGIPVGCVVGFPAGNSTIEVKAFEAGTAIAQGAKEIDMVINIGRALDGEWNYVRKEIAELTSVCHRGGAIIKVIFETAYVSRKEDITTLCHICTEEGTDFMKTSTGYGFVKQADGSSKAIGATLEAVRIMRREAGVNVGVKAAGGIRTLDDVIAFRDAGCTRIGATATEDIFSAVLKSASRVVCDN